MYIYFAFYVLQLHFQICGFPVPLWYVLMNITSNYNIVNFADSLVGTILTPFNIYFLTEYVLRFSQCFIILTFTFKFLIHLESSEFT